MSKVSVDLLRTVCKHYAGVHALAASFEGATAEQLVVFLEAIFQQAIRTSKMDVIVSIASLGHLDLDKYDFASVRGEYGKTLLHAAALKGADSFVDYLLARGLDVNQPCESGLTALHRAAFKGAASTVALLVEKGAHPNARDGQGKTPAHYSAMREDDKSLEVMKALSQSRFAAGHIALDLTICDIHEQTPLLSAIKTGKASLIEPIVKLGGGHAINPLGALMTCKINAAPEMLKQLIRCGLTENNVSEDTLNQLMAGLDMDLTMSEELRLALLEAAKTEGDVTIFRDPDFAFLEEGGAPFAGAGRGFGAAVHADSEITSAGAAAVEGDSSEVELGGEGGVVHYPDVPGA